MSFCLILFLALLWPAAKMEELELAVKARGVVKGYGSDLVLKGLNMDVPYGSM